MCLLPGSAYGKWKNQAVVQYNDFDRAVPPFLLLKAITSTEKPFKKNSFQETFPEYLNRHYSNILLV
jgi:hypothetical protein